ncbi:chymotrypsin inhibitor-like [Prorops nasuta]|uniref:chymotrypsin inhibitor-like n=1 Tax=Prorops nasuta TaxID=863751 RepID=UPI0034CDDAB5
MSRALALLFLFVVVASALPQQPLDARCGENEEFTTCGTSCEPSCTRLQPDICTLNCVIGCQCKSEYVRNTATNKCVLTRDCPQ